MSVLIQAHRAGQILQVAGSWHHRWYRVFIEHGVASEEHCLQKWALLFSWNLEREETEGIVLVVSDWARWHFFSLCPSHSHNCGHKNCSEFCLVALGEVYWTSEFIKWPFWLFSLLSHGPWVDGCTHFSCASVPNSLFLPFWQVVRKALPLPPSFSHLTVPCGPTWVRWRVGLYFLGHQHS